MPDAARARHSAFERAVHAGHRQRRKKISAPRLPGHVPKQRHHGPRRHQIVARQPRTIRQQYVAVRDTGGPQKFALDFQPRGGRAHTDLFAPHGSQQKLRMQIVADLVGEADAFEQRQRNMLRKSRGIRLRRYGRRCRDDRLARDVGVGWRRVLRACRARHPNAARLEQLLERERGRFGGLGHGDVESRWIRDRARSFRAAV